MKIFDAVPDNESKVQEKPSLRCKAQVEKELGPSSEKRERMRTVVSSAIIAVWSGWIKILQL